MAVYLMSLDPEGDWYDDIEGITRYGQTVPAMVEAYGGEYLLKRSDPDVLEGEWNPGPVVLVRFPSRDKLDAFYSSDDYRPWLELRQRAGKTRILIFED